MEAVYENWFDYEVNGKVPFSLIESQFNEEYDNFIKMMNAIDICNESGVVTIILNENNITDKIKEIWHKFKLWVNAVVNRIKAKITQFKKKILTIARIPSNIANIDWDKLALDFDKRYADYWSNREDVIDAEYTVLEASKVDNAKWIGLKANGEVYLADADKVIAYVEKSYPNVYDNIYNAIHGKEKTQNDTNISNKSVSITVVPDFSTSYNNNPKKYVEDLSKHTMELGKAVDKYQAKIDEINSKINSLKVEETSEENAPIVSAKIRDAIKYFKEIVIVYENLINATMKDGFYSGQMIAFTLKKKLNIEEK